MERLKLERPIVPAKVTQRFGEDKTCIEVDEHKKCVSRAEDSLCPPGYESLYAWSGMNGHNGIDFEAAHKQEVFSPIDGVVWKVINEMERGSGIEVISKNKYQLNELSKPCQVKTRYWHLLAYGVSVGEEVRAGQLIGWADNTGLSAGTHLHFELKPVKRRLQGGFRNLYQKNGYHGAIDPEPYFVEKNGE
jgi:murein DD-endopeptidase MepM/ murein hydrolase activator NlpD